MRWLVAGVIAVAIGIAAYLWLRGGGEAIEVPAPRDARVESTPRSRLRALQQQAPAGISGTVTLGAPVAALVCARLVPEERDRVDREPACARAGADGRYTLADLEPGVHVVWASAPKGRGTRREIKLAAGARETVDLVLVAAAASVRGTVRDMRGAAIAGARVHARQGGAIEASTESGADGGFELWTASEELKLNAGADGYVDASAETFVPATDVVLELLPESVLAGIVVEADTRAPVAGATVNVDGWRVETGDDGRFRTRGLPPGRYKPIATAIGRYGEARESVRLGLGVTVEDVVIETHPVAVVAARLVTPSGAGCVEGSAWLSRRGGDAGYFARTTGDGDVLLEGVVPGVYEVGVHCKHHLAEIPYPDLVVADSDVEDVVWRVATGATITGRVSADGAPVAEATVNFIGAAGFGSTTTAADGTYTATGAPSGGVRVMVVAEGFAQGTAEVVVGPGGPARADVVLARELDSIAGLVVDRAGAPVRGHKVVAVGDDGRNTAWTDGAGEFTFRGLAAGAYLVAADDEWATPTEADGIRAVKVTVGKGVARVRLVREPSSGTLAGTVVDAGGAPVTDAYVDLGLDDGEGRIDWRHAAVLVRGGGSFAFSNLPNRPTDRFAVRAFQRGGGETQQAGLVAGARVRLALGPTGVLAGTIVDASGAPVEDAEIEAKDRDRGVSRREHLFRTGGRFALRELPAGRYQVTIDGDGRSAQTLELAEGQQRDDLHFVLSPRYAIRGRLVGADGQPRASWKVEAEFLESNVSVRGRTIVVSTTVPAITGLDGQFLFQGIAGDSAILRTGDPRAVEPEMTELTTVPLRGASTIIDVGDLVAR